MGFFARRGFSLVEVAVASGLLALISASLFEVVATSGQVEQSLRETAAMEAGALTALEQLRTLSASELRALDAAGGTSAEAVLVRTADNTGVVLGLRVPGKEQPLFALPSSEGTAAPSGSKKRLGVALAPSLVGELALEEVDSTTFEVASSARSRPLFVARLRVSWTGASGARTLEFVTLISSRNPAPAGT
jgi:prepilin-type N-terminal cleavage/methylation domain-containing protein